MVHRGMLIGALLGLATGGARATAEARSLELLCPADETVVTFTGVRRPSVTFSWRAADGRPTYRLLVAKAHDFDHPVVDRTTASTSKAVRGLESGTYDWKVIAGGASSSVASFRLK